MTVRAVGSKVPKIAPSAWVSEAAYVVGDVEIGENSSVWPGAVIRGDFAPVRIGSRTHIEDNCIVHTGKPLTIGNNVLVGHGALVHCETVGDNCLIGSQATVLDEAEIGDFSLVAARALVLGGTVVAPRTFVVGAPASVRPARPDQIAMLEAQSGDIGYGTLMARYRDAGL
jgi:carbonic anhydrase/acetyltransferase-like protein (isoleucine patch superfamily)